MIEINNKTKYTVDKKVFSTVAKFIIKGENKGTKTISLAFIDKAEMQKINKKFRKKDKPTNVLSFELKEKDIFGEIIICPDIVEEKKEDMLEVFIHGVLHLCGYDHEKSEKERKVMEQKEKQYLEQLV
jgi:probable rRNA maturation factor